MRARGRYRRGTITLAGFRLRRRALRGHPVTTGLVGLLLLLAACTGEAAVSEFAPPPDTQANPPAAATGGSVPLEGCRPAGDPLPEPGPAAEPMVLSEGPLNVQAFVYPHPDYPGRPWSQWGQGLVLPDGRFLSAIGDHLGADGNSYLYEYDPAAGTLMMIGDVLSFVEHAPGDWGYGKIHGQMVPGPCGEAYFATYWGSRRGLSFGPTYQGDLVFRLHPDERTISSLGVPIDEHGIPSLSGWGEGRLLYGEALDPQSEEREGPFFVYDLESGGVVFQQEEGHTGFRSVAVDAEGRAYFSQGGGRLGVYDPETGQVSSFPATMPGDWLRASTGPGPDGTLYAATRQPDMLFALHPSGEIRVLGPARDYTASLALHPDGSRFFYIPGAHGTSWEQGTPLVSVDTTSGEETVVAELNPLAEQRLGLRLGGTYNIAVDSSGERVYVGLNAGDPGARGSEGAFGEVVLVVVELP